MHTVKAQNTPRRAMLGALMTLTVALAACGGEKKADAAAATPAAPAKTQVTIGPENVTTVTQDTIRSGPSLSGTLTAEKEARIRAEIPGAVLQTYVEAGQRVSAGTVLARIDASALRDASLSARSGLTAAKTAADQAARELQRAKSLLTAGAIAEREVEAAERADLAARSQLADAQARVSAADKQLGSASVRAPFAGVVASRDVNAGDVVSPGAALYTVVDPRSMRLAASIPAEQVSAVRLGSPVRFTVNGYPGKEFVGRITRVSPVADPQTRQVEILASIPNAGSTLVGGLFAEGRVASERRVAMTLPETAVDQRGPQPFVMRLRTGTVDRVNVTIGLRDASTETLEVSGDLAVGDTILLGAARGISVGTPVKVSSPSDQKAPGTQAVPTGGTAQK
ncbi:MAG: efflux RND transporter periplasmic adaptor subunit [Gemmatimonadaceae bacterium]|jgi:RND family efflux transporter MFP subunit|nr:efflux RND transporter periplasmic adaptor subunit [Gemmatimonadaceae bacterium]